MWREILFLPILIALSPVFIICGILRAIWKFLVAGFKALQEEGND